MVAASQITLKGAFDVAARPIRQAGADGCCFAKRCRALPPLPGYRVFSPPPTPTLQAEAFYFPTHYKGQEWNGKNESQADCEGKKTMRLLLLFPQKVLDGVVGGKDSLRAAPACMQGKLSAIRRKREKKKMTASARHAQDKLHNHDRPFQCFAVRLHQFGLSGSHCPARQRSHRPTRPAPYTRPSSPYPSLVCLLY